MTNPPLLFHADEAGAQCMMNGWSTAVVAIPQIGGAIHMWLLSVTEKWWLMSGSVDFVILTGTLKH